MGLFVMVGALVETGVIERFGRWLAEQIGGNLAVAAIIILLVSMLLSRIVDNIPYVATMAPVVSALVASGGAAATCSGGRSRSAPTSAAAPHRSGRAPTSSWAWPPATAHRSLLGVHHYPESSSCSPPRWSRLRAGVLRYLYLRYLM
ncbi:MAG: SLC13 family permease [Nocardioides sp.]